jgi:hypothetical protein
VTTPLRLALDQNFPTPLIDAMRPWVPTDIELTSVRMIDPALSDLSDRELFIVLKQLGFGGLVTNNYKMLNVPEEVAAIIATKATVVAVVGLGHDPIRAVGALLLELPGLRDRIRPGKSNVFRLAYGSRPPKDGWEYLSDAASRLGVETDALWQSTRVTRQEMDTAVLRRP